MALRPSLKSALDWDLCKDMLTSRRLQVSVGNAGSHARYIGRRAQFSSGMVVLRSLHAR
jgi:hypothetical protein